MGEKEVKTQNNTLTSETKIDISDNATQPTGFGFATRPSGFGFGQTTQSTVGFGFDQTSEAKIDITDNTTQPGFGGFGQSTQPTSFGFGGFGQSTQPTGFGFGAARPSSFRFGQTTQPAPGGFGFGATRTSGFVFGQTTQPAPGGFGFGATSPSGFGFGQMTQPAPGGFGFGATRPSGFGFGQTTQPAPGGFGFGATRPSGFGFGQTTQPAPGGFGFGATSPSGFGFGQTTQPAPGGFGFGATRPSGFGFGQMTQPAAGDIKEHEEIENHKPVNEIEEHKKSIVRIFVSQYMDDTSTYNEYGSDDYVVTFSEDDKSVLGWSINEKGVQKSDVYFKIDKLQELDTYVLSKKILSLCDLHNHWLIDLNGDRKDRFLELKHQVIYNRITDQFDNIGFLPNGDLIKVSVKDRKIHKYCFINKPKNAVPWECSQIFDIKIPESLDGQVDLHFSIQHRTKLFLIYNDCNLLQFDLLTMNLERQYHKFKWNPKSSIIMNKSQTLLATVSNNIIDIYSMENGMLIIEYHCRKRKPIELVEFITLKENSERLFIKFKSGCILVVPYQLYCDIDDDFETLSVLTRLNKKIFIDNGNVKVADGIDENKLQQSLSESSCYTLSTFKTIQHMLKKIKQGNIEKVVPFDKPRVIVDNVEINNKGLCKIIFYKENKLDCVGIKQNNVILKPPTYRGYILSFKLLDNQDLVLILIEGILIYTITENGLSIRYFWSNNEWDNIFINNYMKGYQESLVNRTDFKNENYKPPIERILKYEFNDLKHSIPFPNFINEYMFEVKDIVEDVINDIVVLPKFGIEMLKIAIERKNNDVVRQIIESTQGYSENYMTIFSLNLPELCDYYPDFIIKYISSTSIMLSPYCNDIGNSKNTSLHSYTDIYIKESNMEYRYFKEIYKGLIRHLRIKEEVQTVSFIVPFPQICVYQDGSKNNDHENHETENNHDIKSEITTIFKKTITILKILMMIPKCNSIWNELLFKPKSILFCNIDSNHFYNWWNFAAIIDFKWKTFGWIYYYLIWFFYTILYVCYSLASALDQNFIPDFYFKLLFIISIIFGSIFLNFEIRQCLWNYKFYFNDIWNLFDVGAYLLPIITSIFWFINKSPPFWLTAISIILLSFKFILFFRVFKSYGIYFAIIIGVAKKVFPFLVLLFFIVFGYAQAFFIVLRSNNINDDNDPRNVATKYVFVNPDGTISNTTTIIQDPDSNTNLFNWFPTSLLAVYKLLAGDSGSLSSFTYREHPIMTILLVTFTLFTVIYLMNLFIGLVNLAIDDYNKKEEFLLQKAQIIMEIELFYMFPCQRRNKKWFPDWIYYNMPVTEIRKLINAIDNKQTVFNYPPIIDEALRKLVVLTDDNKKQDNKLEKKPVQNVEREIKMLKKRKIS